MVVSLLPFLLLDDTAGDAVAGIAGGVAHQVVGFRMDHQRSSTVVKERVCAVGERGAFDGEAKLAIAVRTHREIGQITEMRTRFLRIVDAVMGAGGVKVATGGGEGRAFALADVVDVNTVLAG